MCVASAAVDALMTSRWCSAKNDKSPLFHSRSSCVNFCERFVVLEPGILFANYYFLCMQKAIIYNDDTHNIDNDDDATFDAMLL